MYRSARTPEQHRPRGGGYRPIATLLVALAVAAAALVGTASPASAAAPKPAATFAATVVSGTSATVTFTVNRPAAAILAGACLLTRDNRNLSSVTCGSRTSTSSTTTYRTTLSGLLPGAYRFAVAGIVRDGLVAASTTFRVVANDAPTAAPDAYQSSEDTTLTVSAAHGVLGNDGDPNGDPLTAAVAGPTAHGTLTLSADGGFSYTPKPDYHGPDQFTYTASDGRGGTRQSTVSITVLPVNDAPVAVDDDGLFSGSAGVAQLIAIGDLLANDTDVDGDTLSLLTVAPSIGGTVTRTGADTLTFQPDAGFIGAARFTYTVSDGHGASAMATVRVHFLPVNRAPVAADDSGFTVGAGATLTITTAQLIGNDTDADGDPLTITGVAQSVGGTATLESGTVTFAAAPCSAGTASFAYAIDDGHGGEDSATVTIDVAAPAADADGIAPTTAHDAFLLDEDTVFLATGSTDPLANDTASEPCAALTITEMRIGPGAPAGGELVLVGGVWRYTPPREFSGTVELGYRATDGDLGATRVITLTYAPVNDAPVAVEDYPPATPSSTPIVIAIADLVENDTDADGPFTLTSVARAAGATGISVSLTGDQITVTPDAGFVGWSGFNYTLDDGEGGVTVSPAILVPVTPDTPSTVLRDACPAVTHGGEGWLRAYSDGLTAPSCLYRTGTFANDAQGIATIQTLLDQERARIGSAACESDRLQLTASAWYGLDDGPLAGIHATLSVTCVVAGGAGEPDACTFAGGEPVGIGDSFRCAPASSGQDEPAEFVPDRAFCEAFAYTSPNDTRWAPYADICREILGL